MMPSADLVPSWQPIETAPLGERLLAYHEHIDGFAVCVVVADSQGKRTTLLDWDMMVFNATHWMPLPEPPIEA